MTIFLRWTAALALLAAAACQGGDSATSAPWLTYPGVDGHSKYLPLAGTAHDPSAAGTTVTCTGCHTDPSSFRMFQCTTTCHTSAVVTPLHTGLTDFTYGDQACYDCHRAGIAAPANHNTAFFPVGAGTKHAGIRCSECHTDLANPNDPHNFNCASCHQGLSPPLSAHGPVNIQVPNNLGGFDVLAVGILTVHTGQSTVGTPLSLTSESCLRCHADSQVDRVSAHSTSGDAFGRSQHAQAGCVTCHSTFRADKPFATNFGSNPGCIICHTTGIPN
jgi:hypothetical protein